MMEGKISQWIARKIKNRASLILYGVRRGGGWRIDKRDTKMTIKNGKKTVKMIM